MSPATQTWLTSDWVGVSICHSLLHEVETKSAELNAVWGFVIALNNTGAKTWTPSKNVDHPNNKISVSISLDGAEVLSLTAT